MRRTQANTQNVPLMMSLSNVEIIFNSQFHPRSPSKPPPHYLNRFTRFSHKLSTIFYVQFRFWSASLKALTFTKSPAVYPMPKSESNQLYYPH